VISGRVVGKQEVDPLFPNSLSLGAIAGFQYGHITLEGACVPPEEYGLMWAASSTWNTGEFVKAHRLS
jgi:hypothetical protein